MVSPILALPHNSSRVLVEGDLSNRTFASAEGTRSTHTFVTQRMFLSFIPSMERKASLTFLNRLYRTAFERRA